MSLKNAVSNLVIRRQYPFYLRGRTDVLFVHITKTGGTSIRNTLDFNRIKKGYTKKHYHVQEIIELIGQKKWDSAFKFTIVRNPWDRLFSHYRFRQRKENQQHLVSASHFKVWAKQLLCNQAVLRKPVYASQTQWLADRNNVIDLDFIGRFENLTQDYLSICEHIGSNPPLKHINQSLPIVDYRHYYDEEMRQLVVHLYGRDIDYFKYIF